MADIFGVPSEGTSRTCPDFCQEIVKKIENEDEESGAGVDLFQSVETQKARAKEM